MKNISMIVFDMAGTTIDEDNIVYKTLHKAIAESGVMLGLDEVLSIGAGKEKLNAIKDILAVYGNAAQQAQADEIFTRFLAYLEDAYNQNDIKPTENAEEVLKALRLQNIKVVLNTGYDKQTAVKLLNKIEWKIGEQFDLLVTASDVPNSRPAPDMIVYAMNHFGISDASTVVKVGDSAIDIEEGKNASCIFNIGVTTGAQTKEQIEKANPNFIFNDLRELLILIEETNKSSEFN